MDYCQQLVNSDFVHIQTYQKFVTVNIYSCNRDSSNCLYAIQLIVTKEMYIYMYGYSSLCTGISANTSKYYYNRKHK